MWSRRSARRCAASASLCFTLCFTAASAWAQPIDDEHYIVVKGDTCVGVSAKVWPGDPEKVNTLHALNPELAKLPEPHKLKLGMRLRVRGDNPDARVTFIRPKVNAKRRGKAEWKPAQQGQGLYRLDSVSTLDGASAEVKFRDQSELSLDANALIVIYGIHKGAALKVRTPKSGSVELVHGDMRLRLKELRGEGPRVQTPAADIAVAPGSKELAIGVDGKQMSRVSAIDGEAEIAAKGKARKDKLRVQKGYGTRIEPGKAPEAPVKLPLSPAWTTAGARDVYAAIGGDGAEVTLAWTAVADAAIYRAQLGRDPALNDRLLDAPRDQKSGLAAKQPAVGPGRYHARVSGYTATGLVGLPAAPRLIDVVAVTPGPTRRGAGLTGVGELALGLGDTPALEVTLDGATAPGRSLLIRGVGKHQLRIAPLGDAGRAAELTVDIVAPRAEIMLAPSGDALEARVRLLDDEGAPVVVTQAPELILAGEQGTKVSALVRDGVQWTARVVPATTADARRAVVTAQWNQLEIGRAEDVKILSRPRKPVALTQPAALVSPIGQVAGDLDYATAPNPWMPSAWVFAVRVQPELAGDTDRDLQLAFGTEIPIGRRFVLYGTLAGRDTGQLPLTFGARAHLVGGPRASLGVAADLTMSSLDSEPVLHARGAALGSLVLGRFALQLVAAVVGGGEDRGGTLGAQLDGTIGVFLTSRLVLAAGAEHLLGDGFSATAAAASLRFRLAPFELQLGIRKGIGDDGEAAYGDLAGVFALEFRPGTRW